MSCGLSRSELTTFNIPLDENQRCQAICPGGGDVCNSLLTDHAKDKSDDNKPSHGSTHDDISESEDNEESSSCCGRLSKRALHLVQVMLVTYTAITFIVAMFASGINFQIPTSEVSHLTIDNDADALQFWSRTSRIGLNVIEYDEEDGNDHGEEHSYTYSSTSLDEYNCDLDATCEDTVDDLSAAWDTLLIASSVCALLCILSWLLGAVRNAYPCLYNTRVYQAAVREQKPVLMWFIKPIGLTYLLACLYSVAFGVQFVAFFKYISHLPSNEEMYRLSLHYMNSDPTLCSPLCPCEYPYDSIEYFNRNVSFIVASVVCAALAVVLVAASHRLKLSSLRWDCCCLCFRERQQLQLRGDSTSVPTEEEVDPESQSPSASASSVPVESSCLEIDGSGVTPQAVLVTTSEVQLVEVDSKHAY